MRSELRTASRINRWSLLLAFITITSALATAVQAQSPSRTVVISQVYGGGGNAGSTFTHDFIELHNRSNAPVNLSGFFIQYASATGNFVNVGDTFITPLTGTIAAGGYFLIQEAPGAGGSMALPAPNLVDATPIAMSATVGKLMLSFCPAGQASLPTGISCPTAANYVGSCSVIDFVGYGLTANCFEGAGPTPAPSNTVAVQRLANGSRDTNNNNADFVVTLAPPTPRNAATTPIAPTNVTIDNFHAKLAAGKATLTWRANALGGALGFNVYRDENGVRTRVNQSMIIIDSLLGTGQSNASSMRELSVIDVQPSANATYWLEVNNTDGTISMHGTVKLTN